MICIKCGVEVPDAPFCCQCGAKQSVATQNKKTRGNGQGSVFRLANGKYKAVKTLGYYLDSEGQRHRRQATKTFTKKKDAINALPGLGKSGIAAKAEQKSKITFINLFERWIPTHQAGRDTLNCYKAAVKYYTPIYHERVSDIDVDDLQECINECPKGKPTKKNMRTVVGLMYKYGIPRGYVTEKLNLADYLSVSGESGNGGSALPDEYVEKIKSAVGEIPGADFVYAQCYLGFRPSEFLSLDAKDYNRRERAFTGGAKTDAGKNRIVTVSPKIYSIVDRLTKNKVSGPVFCGTDGKRMDITDYRSLFYSVLDALELQNPIYIVDGKQRHTYTPHSCRHTFATLMKRISGNDTDKLKLIGHTSEEMLRYYQDTSFDDLRKITDNI